MSICEQCVWYKPTRTICRLEATQIFVGIAARHLNPIDVRSATVHPDVSFPGQLQDIIIETVGRMSLTTPFTIGFRACGTMAEASCGLEECIHPEQFVPIKVANLGVEPLNIFFQNKTSFA